MPPFAAAAAKTSASQSTSVASQKNMASLVTSPPSFPTSLTENDWQTTSSGLQYVIVQKGTGSQAKAGDTVQCHYCGWLLSGKKFDSSYDRDQVLEFPVGRGMVIPGWEEGLQLMRIGDVAFFKIPSDLAYGERGVGPIPAGSDLIFQVSLEGIR